MSSVFPKYLRQSPLDRHRLPADASLWRSLRPFSDHFAQWKQKSALWREGGVGPKRFWLAWCFFARKRKRKPRKKCLARCGRLRWLEKLPRRASWKGNPQGCGHFVNSPHFHPFNCRTLRLSIWLIRYFLKTFVYTPSTPCRDVKFSQNIPLSDLSWKSLAEVMWRHHINGFSNSIFGKTDKKTSTKEWKMIGLTVFILLYVWNNEDVRWDFFCSNPLRSYEQIWVSRRAEKT